MIWVTHTIQKWHLKWCNTSRHCKNEQAFFIFSLIHIAQKWYLKCCRASRNVQKHMKNIFFHVFGDTHFPETIFGTPQNS